MLNSISKFLIVLALGLLLSAEYANAQVQMTKLPTRIEEVLINPNLSGILRGEVEVNSRRKTVVAETPRPLALSGPTYSNESSRYFGGQLATADRDAQAAAAPRVAERLEDTPAASRLTPRRRNDRRPSQQADSLTDGPSDPPVELTPIDTDSPLQPTLGKLRVRLSGVASMIESQPAELLVEVFNPTGQAVGPVDVNVQVPEDLTITRFNRDAWLDSEQRIIAFRLEKVEAGGNQKITMRGISHSAGKTNLNVMLSSGETMVAQKSFPTQVFPQQIARKYTFGDAQPKETLQK